MFDYRCYFYGPDNRIAALNRFEAASDSDAMAFACRLDRERRTPHHGFELWQDRRCVSQNSSRNSWSLAATS